MHLLYIYNNSCYFALEILKLNFKNLTNLIFVLTQLNQNIYDESITSSILKSVNELPQEVKRKSWSLYVQVIKICVRGC